MTTMCTITRGMHIDFNLLLLPSPMKQALPVEYHVSDRDSGRAASRIRAIRRFHEEFPLANIFPSVNKRSGYSDSKNLSNLYPWNLGFLKFFHLPRHDERNIFFKYLHSRSRYSESCILLELGSIIDLKGCLEKRIFVVFRRVEKYFVRFNEINFHRQNARSVFNISVIFNRIMKMFSL